ncbi:MAG: pentapeptide repeat-containing protein [Candidatus Aenigmatarchaeota archaeon]
MKINIIMNLTNLKQMPRSDILTAYKNGERSFHGIRCIGQDFYSTDLRDIDFTGSDLGFCGFQGADLTGASFSNCILVWSCFDRANLTGTKFDGAKLNWSALNDAIVMNTSMKRVDLSNSILLNTPRNNMDLTGANATTATWSLDDITSQGISFAKDNLATLKSLIPYDLWLRIKFKIEHQGEEAGKARRSEHVIPSYLDHMRGQYSSDERKVLRAMGLSVYADGGKNMEYGSKISKDLHGHTAYGK